MRIPPRFLIKKPLLTAFLLGFAAIAPAHAAQVCKPEFMAVLQKRAYMEAERETIANNAIVSFPDTSTLAISCWDETTNQLSQHAKLIFSDTGKNPATGQPIALAGYLLSDISVDDDEWIDSTGEYIVKDWEFTGANANTEDFKPCTTMRQLKQAALGTTNTPTSYIGNLSFTAIQHLCTGGVDVRDKAKNPVGKATCPIISAGFGDAIEASTDLKKMYNPTEQANLMKGIDYAFIGAKDASGFVAAGKHCSDVNAIPTGAPTSYAVTVGGKAPGTKFWGYSCASSGCYFNPEANASATLYPGSGEPPVVKCSDTPW